MMHRLFALTALCWSLSAWADATSTGHTYTPPEAFSSHSAGAVLRFKAPEQDADVFLVDLPDAKDGADAVAQAWALAMPGFARKLRLATAQANRNGWTDQQVFEYETSPNERLFVQAMVKRSAMGDRKAWVVVLMYAAEGTLEKREAPIFKFVASVRPQGYQRERFAGRAAKPLTPERIELLKTFVADGMKQLDVPGVALSFIQNGKVLWAGGLGVREIGKPAKVDANTLFMAASNTKAMTTALLARAVDAGKLRWDQPATEAYPGFKLADPEITRQILVKHLVCACTGMPRQDLDWLFTDHKAPAQTVFAQLATMKPTSRFGEVFQYSNLMVGAGGYIAAAALRPGQEVGAAYDRAMRDLLFAPLGMHHTTFDYAKALGGNHAEPHAKGLDGRTRVVQMDLNHTIIPARPAGAVWTSAKDFSRWVLMELAEGKTPEGKPLLSKANWAERYVPQIMTGEDTHYGMGLFVNRQYGIPIASHGGDMLGFHSNMVWLPEQQIGFTILTNADAGVQLRGPLLRKLLELVFDGTPEADERVRLAAKNQDAELDMLRKMLTLPVPSDLANALAPEYREPALGKLTVQRQGGVLRFVFDTWSSEMALRKNEDGTHSFMSVEPGVMGFEFVVDHKADKPALVLRAPQMEYRFVATR